MSKYQTVGKIANAAGVPSDVTQWLTDPVESAGKTLGMSPAAIEVAKFAINPPGYSVGKIKDMVRNLPSTEGVGHVGGEGSSVDQGFNLRRRGFDQDEGFKRGGKVKSKSKASSASKRADGIAQRGKTKGRYI